MVFEPGVIANPSGRPKLSEQEKEFRDLAPRELAIIAKDMLFNKSVYEVKKMSEDNGLPSIYGMMAKYLYASYKDGDPKNFEWLLSRTIGKVREFDPLSDTTEVKSDPVRLNALRDLVRIGLGLRDGTIDNITSSSGTIPGPTDSSGLLRSNEEQIGSNGQASGTPGKPA